MPGADPPRNYGAALHGPEPHHQGTLVMAVHAAFIDADMAGRDRRAQISSESIARQVVASHGSGTGKPQFEVLRTSLVPTR
ncbi:MAG TPA: hypothetical protein VH520_09170 [Streptosporangiaceae bacterium]